MGSVPFTPQGWTGRLADACMTPVMYLLQGQTAEVPQRTHIWNNKKFQDGALAWLDSEMMCTVAADLCAQKRGNLPRFHMPILGGWKNFVVLAPLVHESEWFVGWKSDDVSGLSLIPLFNQVRVLRGPEETNFFGVNRQGRQIPLVYRGEGVIGQKHLFASVPLL
jgi:hypothetical protein